MNQSDPFTQHSSVPPPLPSAPPTVQGAMGEQKSSWPQVFGIISIVLGALGTFKYGCGAIGSLFLGGMGFYGGMAQGLRNSSPQAAQSAQALAGMDTMMIVTGSTNILGLVCAVILLVAGINLTRRTIGGFRLHRTWAWVRIASVVIEVVATVIVQSSVMGGMVNAGGPGGPPAGMMVGFAIVGGLIGIIIGLAYPIVVLSYWRKPAVQAEAAAWART